MSTVIHLLESESYGNNSNKLSENNPELKLYFFCKYKDCQDNLEK